MNRFSIFILALGLAFVAGWLFGNEMRPPRYEDLSMGVWLVLGGGAVMSAALASK